MSMFPSSSQSNYERLLEVKLKFSIDLSNVKDFGSRALAALKEDTASRKEDKILLIIVKAFSDLLNSFGVADRSEFLPEVKKVYNKLTVEQRKITRKAWDILFTEYKRRENGGSHNRAGDFIIAWDREWARLITQYNCRPLNLKNVERSQEQRRKEIKKQRLPKPIKVDTVKSEEACWISKNRVPEIKKGVVGGIPVETLRGIGGRSSQQDLFLTDELVVGDKTHQLFAVMDGHGIQMDKKDTAFHYVQRNLKEKLKQVLKKSEGNYISAIKQVTAFLHDGMSKDPCMLDTGTTLTFALKCGGDIWVASVGDSPAILVTDADMYYLLERAEATSPRAKSSVSARGGVIDCRGRLFGRFGSLAMYRAIGDHFIDGVNPRASVLHLNLEDEEFSKSKSIQLILASDGVDYLQASSSSDPTWLYSGEEQVVGILRESGMEAVQTRFATVARAAGFVMDNFTVMAIQLK